MGSRYLWKPVRTLRQACRGSANQGRDCLLCELADQCMRDAEGVADSVAAPEPLVQDVTHDGGVQSRIDALCSSKRELCR